MEWVQGEIEENLLTEEGEDAHRAGLGRWQDVNLLTHRAVRTWFPGRLEYYHGEEAKE
ncbi:hypothetical protein JXA88_18945 [Candidatus Fermentibacteria bacterium]|nr:hypothetical protein [Candidatus Fermentibacteria bacterium]